jgi:hypothetical protein
MTGMAIAFEKRFNDRFIVLAGSGVVCQSKEQNNEGKVFHYFSENLIA